jgi:hypothetical protein
MSLRWTDYYPWLKPNLILPVGHFFSRNAAFDVDFAFVDTARRCWHTGRNKSSTGGLIALGKAGYAFGLA